MKTVIISLKLLILMTLLTGIIYPVFIWGISQVAFPLKADGTLIKRKDRIVGSELIGQKFTSKKYFHSRPSAIDYEPMPSGGSNLAPTSNKLKNVVDSIRAEYIKINELQSNADVPSDVIFSSASGIDPHISVQNAMLQVNRISKERGFDNTKRDKLIELVQKCTEEPQFGILGGERINVLILNLELDKL